MIILNGYTTYSKGITKINDLIDYCKNNDIKGIGICDENLSYFYKFYNQCKENNLKFTIGYEYENIKFYAKDYEGVMNLIKFHNDITLKNKLSFPKNCIVITSSLEVLNKVKTYNDIYIEFNLWNKNDVNLKKISKEYKIPIVIGMNFYKIDEQHNSIKEIKNQWILSKNEMIERCKTLNIDLLELELYLKNNEKLINLCNIEIPKNQQNFPKFIDNSFDKLKEIITKQWYVMIENKTINSNFKVYKERVKYELSIIKDKNISDYFLILKDLYIHIESIEGAVGVGRGSATGSLLLFILGLTKIDPIKFNLIFERFLNPERIDLPDVDCDIDTITHSKVKSYLETKYNNVYHICNFSEYKTKSLFKDVCNVLKIPFQIANKITSYINDDVELESELERLKNSNNEIVSHFLHTNIDKILTYKHLIGTIRQTGTHASGILISNNLNIPLISKNNEHLIGLQEGGAFRELSDLGYLKLDILGLNVLNIINGVFKNVKNLEQKILNSNFDDVEVYNKFCNGDCKDIFQFGSTQMIELIKKVKPKTINDLIAINSLWRPAIIQAGGIDEYLKNRNDIQPIKNKLDKIHHKLWDILKETYGVPIYQEQIIFILKEVAGFSISEADNCRKILKTSYKSKNNEFNDILNRINNEYLSNLLVTYNQYSFNKSHSTAYSINAYICQYLKVHYTLEYFVSYLNNIERDKIPTIIEVCKLNNIEFNEFKHGQVEREFKIVNNKISYSFSIVKGFEKNDIEKILSIKSTNWNDLLIEIKDKKINKTSFENLKKVNYFIDYFQYNCSDKNYNDILGFYHLEHPFISFEKKLNAKYPNLIYTSPKNIKQGKVIGIVSKITIKKSKKTNKNYYIIKLEDDKTSISFNLFEEILKENDCIVIDIEIKKENINKKYNTNIYKYE